MVAQIAKNPTPVPDHCPVCKTALYCETCGTSHLHRPYPKQAIEQLFAKYIVEDSSEFYKQAISTRNALLHGEEVSEIERSLNVDFAEMVDKIGHLAWVSLINQFAKSMVGTKPTFLQTSQYVYKNLTGRAHINIGMKPNFDNPDPAEFPKIDLSMTRHRRPIPPDVEGDDRSREVET